MVTALQAGVVLPLDGLYAAAAAAAGEDEDEPPPPPPPQSPYGTRDVELQGLWEVRRHPCTAAASLLPPAMQRYSVGHQLKVILCLQRCNAGHRYRYGVPMPKDVQQGARMPNLLITASQVDEHEAALVVFTGSAAPRSNCMSTCASCTPAWWRP